ncbi:MAG: Wadjet anti-phage system protein JetD domain-containing protein [Thiogranum sp.]
MNWTGPRELRGQLQRAWDRGELLAGVVSGESPFPRRLTLKGPTSVQMAEHFDGVRAWIAELNALPHYRIEMRALRHRVLGANEVPGAVWVDTLDAALRILGKQREAKRFAVLVECTRERQPLLLEWIARKPLRALMLADVWDRLLDVVDWVRIHPRPGVYLRQVDIAGVHSKFIEAHRGVLIQWLDSVLPPEAVDTTASGVSGFARRYGFRDKPQRIRLRMLDPAHALLPGSGEADITLDAESFTRLTPTASRVFITENEINFLAFPRVPDSLLIFGAGYGFEVLAQATWLTRCQVFYWGDIDTHGFAILDQLRTCLPHARSLLMDHATLLAFEAQWGVEDKQTLRDLPRLNVEECVLYDHLRDNRLRSNLRLEQERIGFAWVEAALAGLETGNKVDTA